MRINIKKKIILLLTVVAIISSLSTITFADIIMPGPIRGDSIIVEVEK